MRKRKVRQQKLPGVGWRKPSARIVIATAIVVSLFAAWTMLAYSGALDRVFSQKAEKKGLVSLASFTSPSKEYIYAGGRLVATEESPQSCDTSNPTFDTDSDGIPNGVEPDEGRNPCLKDNDIFNDARLFAMQQYRDFLNREGDPGGIAGWTNAINSGSLTRAQVADAFFNSQEFQAGASPAIIRLYLAYFLRPPDYGGLNNWVNALRSGISLEQISQAFAQSQEFQIRYGSLNNDQFVTLLYQNVLGRDPDPGGFANWTNALNSGTLNRGQVMLGFSESPEFKTKSFNEVYVTQMYAGMLKREPDPGGFDFWVNQLNGGASGLTLIQGFLGAAEYHNRFLP